MGTSPLARAVRNGIEVELAAERFYRLLAESTEEAESKRFLNEMAAQEAEHAARIEALGKDLEAGELPRYSDPGVETVETSPDWAYVDGLGYRDALSLALQNEEHAALTYSALAESTQGVISEFFAQLTRDEEQHIEAIQARLDKLKGYPPSLED